MDENGTESGGVDAQMPVTACVDASGYENVSQLDLLSFWAVFSGCWLSLWVWAWSLLGLCLSPLVLPFVPFPFRWGSNSKKKRAPTPKPALIRRSLF